MNPKKPKKLEKQTAQSLDIQEQLVSDLVHFYWVRVRKALTTLAFPRVRVENLGTFTVRVNRLRGMIKNTETYIADVDQSSFQGYSNYDRLSERLTQLKTAMSTLETEWEERKDHYETRRKTSNDLEK